MATAWYIQKNNRKVGPLSGQQLRELALAGKLQGDDLVRKGEDGEFVFASKVNGLFVDDPVLQRPSLPPAKPSCKTPQSSALINQQYDGDKTPRKSNSNTRESLWSSVLKSVLKLGEQLKRSGQFAALYARQKKLQTVDLGSAMTKLGRVVHSSLAFESEFRALFSQINEEESSLENHGSQSESTTNSPQTKGILESAANRIKQKGHEIRSDIKLKSLYQQLGHAVYQKHGPKSGPKELISEIEGIYAEISLVETRINELKETGSTLNTLIPRLAACVLLFAILAGILYWSSSGLPFFDNTSSTNLADESSANMPGNNLSQQTRRLKQDTIDRINAEDQERTAQLREMAENRAKLEVQRNERQQANLQASHDARLSEWRRMFVVPDHNKSSYPDRPLTNQAIQLFEMPVASLATELDQIEKIDLAPDGSWMRYEDRIALTSELSAPSVDSGLISNPTELSFFKSLGLGSYDTLDVDRQDVIRQVDWYYKPRVAKTNVIDGESRFSSNSIVGFERWGALGGALNLNLRGVKWSDALSFWRKDGDGLSLVDIHGLIEGAQSLKISTSAERPLMIVDGGFSKEKFVVLVSYGSRAPRPPEGVQVQVWEPTRLLGVTDISYKVGSAQKYAHQIDCQRNGSLFALHYGDTVRIFDASKLSLTGDNLPPVATLESPYPASYGLEGRGYLRFLPNSNKLVVGFPVHDEQADADYILVRLYDTKDWNLISESRSSPGSINVSPSEAHFVIVPDERNSYPPYCFEVFDVNKMSKTRFCVRDGTNAVFVGDSKLAIGGAASSPKMYVTASGDRKRMDVSVRNINIFDLPSGQLWGRIPLRNGRAIAATPDGRFLITGKDKHINSGAVLEKWDISHASRVLPFADEFQLYREIEYRDIQGTPRAKQLAPAILPDDFKKLEEGMTYQEIEQILLGLGRCQAEAVKVDKSESGYDMMIRLTVTYPAVAERGKRECQLVFEGDLFGTPNELKLARKLMRSLD